MRRTKCIVDTCNEPAHYKSSDLCVNCYAALWYWGRKTPTQVVRRRRNLAKYEARLELMQPSVRLATRTTRKKRAARAR